jgi:hypothetical protein
VACVANAWKSVLPGLVFELYFKKKVQTFDAYLCELEFAFQPFGILEKCTLIVRTREF